MKVLNIKSIPIDKVMLELADLLEAEIIEDCKEFTLSIPKRLGSGYIRGVAFGNGLGFINYACTFNEDVEINFIRNRVHPLKFIYTLDGILVHQFEETEKEQDLEKFQYCVLASQSSFGHVIKFSKDETLMFNSLEIDRRIYYSLMSCSIEKMDEQLKDLFKDVLAKEAFYHKGYYSLEIADIFQQIEDFEGKEAFRKIFLESIVQQMLLQEVTQFDIEVSGENAKVLLKKHEIKAIEEANLIIMNEIANLPTIKEISYRVGLNSNKLQDGFRRMYQTTVNGHVKDKRLEMSKKLLSTSNLTIAEISDQIGITSKSYFSKIFKETYKMSPNEFRKKNSHTTDCNR
ncbi:AraC family transcriptional regulator [Christiangramia sp.]|uniref:helix-turn-helix domain-containing protein n=1 Tax=Christiangramia sp. TaxID=1931228 RepID=UPI0026311FDB|nr:AraC family transcriptional regulator [Christiangramia sp.]